MCVVEYIDRAGTSSGQVVPFKPTSASHRVIWIVSPRLDVVKKAKLSLGEPIDPLNKMKMTSYALYLSSWHRLPLLNTCMSSGRVLEIERSITPCLPKTDIWGLALLPPEVCILMPSLGLPHRFHVYNPKNTHSSLAQVHFLKGKSTGTV